MSYILDALRKADAQRERSRAPGLHDHTGADAAADRTAGWRRAPLLWAAVAVGVLSIALVGWQMAQPPAAAERAVAVVAPTETPTAPAAEPVPPPPVVATAVVPPPPEPRPEPKPEPKLEPRPPAATHPAPAVATSAPAPAPAAASSSAPAEIGPAPAGAPKLAISGGVYSPSPTQRMLIVGGQVFNEGSEVAPGVRLEQVRPNQAVLSWRGQRYAVRY